MGEIKSFAFCKIRFYFFPEQFLSRVREEIHDDRGFFGGFLQFKKSLVWNETVCNGLVPRGGIFALADYDFETLIAHV